MVNLLLIPFKVSTISTLQITSIYNNHNDKNKLMTATYNT